MIGLARHIEILLLTNDCVIVPGFGGFVAHYKEARYEQDEQLFLPPLRTIGFNPQLKLNDSLLVLSYTETYDISYPEALRRIESEVHELRQHLETERFYELNGIGQLTLNPEGSLQFEPCEAGILTPSLYGLGSFSMKPLSEEVISQENHQTAKKPEGGHEAITIRMSWLRNAVAIAAAIVAFFLIAPPVANTVTDESTVNKMELNVLPKLNVSAKATLPAPEDTTSNSERSETLTNATESEPQVSSPETTVSSKSTAENTVASTHSAKTATSSASSTFFCIVLASQVSRANAEDFVGRLKKAGYSHARVYEHHSLRRVIYGCYETQQEAVNELRAVRGGKFFEEAWVMEVKK